jgi:hypothetical protein
MISTDLFSDLFEGDTDMNNIRKKITFKKFKENIAENISIDEFVYDEYTKWYISGNPTYIYLCEKYIAKQFFISDTANTEQYTVQMIDRLSILYDSVLNSDIKNKNSILNFIEFSKKYITNSKTVFSEKSLLFFNTLFVNSKKQ